MAASSSSPITGPGSRYVRNNETGSSSSNVTVSPLFTFTADGSIDLPSTLSPEDLQKVISQLAKQNQELTDRLAERDGTIKEQKQRFDLQVMALSREIELKKRENFNLSDAFDEEKMKAERYASGLRARIQCLEEDAGIVSPSERAFLEADITHAQTQCDKLREQVLKLQAQIAPHKIEIGELSSTIRQKEEEIAELKKRIFHLEERIKSMFELTRTFYDSSPFLR